MYELSYTEENYLKAIFHLSQGAESIVSTNAIADHVRTKPASVTDMMKKLAKKQLIAHERYKGVQLTVPGRKKALMIVRKHRLWEVFLFEKLQFGWDEVHEIAEQLEHIQSAALINRLDEFLGSPKVDPHGDPIPDKEGEIAAPPHIPLSSLTKYDQAIVSGVKDEDPALLRFLDRMKIRLGLTLQVLEKVEFDGSLHVSSKESNKVFLSKKIADQLMMRKI